MALQLIVTIDQKGAALVDNWEYEAARLLRKAADKVEGFGLGGDPLLDSNGNTAGWLEIKEKS